MKIPFCIIKNINIKPPANDNQKWEHFDEAVEVALKAGYDWSYVTACFRLPPNHMSCSPYAAHENFLWFIKFEQHLRQSEIMAARCEIKVVK